MSEFTGKICPFCRTEFQEGDDIVVCSSCEMPHHKECWIENQGCTTFGCSGTIRGVDGGAVTLTTQAFPNQAESMPRLQPRPVTPQPMATTMAGAMATSAAAAVSAVTAASADVSLPEYIFCRKCGQRCRSTDTFCIKCGTKHIIPGFTPGGPAVSPAYAAAAAPAFSPYTPSTPREASSYTGYDSQAGYPGYGYQSGDLSREEALFIGKNVDTHYRRVFETMRRHGMPLSWNWCAFLFTPFWLFYRKMFFLGSVSLATFLLQLYLTLVAPFCVTAVASIFFGLFGDRLYMRHVTAKLRRINAKRSVNQDNLIAKHGGVSVTACILLPLLFFLLLILTLLLVFGEEAAPIR